MAQISLTITIPDDKVDEVLDAFEQMAPIPKVHSDPDDPTSPLVPEYTRAQWPRAWLRRQIVNMVRRYRVQQGLAGVSSPDMSDLEVT